MPTRHPAYKWIAILASIIALLRCGPTVRTFNHTTDELAHIAGAVGLHESGHNIYMVEHPPLQRLWVGWWLYSAGAEHRLSKGQTEVASRADANVVGEEILFHSHVSYWTLLTVARLANLLFAAILFFYVYRLARYLINPLAAMLATVFISLDPNILAHAGLVTTDVPAAAGFVAAAYYAIRFVARPTARRAVIAGIALGLAMSCKFTCVLLAPAIIVLILFRATRAALTRPASKSASLAFWRKIPEIHIMLTIAIIAFLALWSTYLFDIGKLSNQALFTDQKTWVKIPDSIKNTSIPMPSMALGLMFMASLGKTGFPVYLNGHIDLAGKWYYFPEAIALKSPVALLAAIALAAIVFAFSKNRRSTLTLVLVLAPSLLLLTAMTGKLQIGIRHILPVIPFIYLLVALHLHRARLAPVLILLIAVAAFETARAHPDYLSYFNTLAGGPDKGQKYLADSNLDWGQDVARLAQYLKSIKSNDYTIKVSGARVAALVEYLGLDPLSRETDIPNLEDNPHGLLAVGINAKIGLEGYKRNSDGTTTPGDDYDWLKNYPLIQRMGHSIEVYDLDHPKP